MVLHLLILLLYLLLIPVTSASLLTWGGLSPRDNVERGLAGFLGILWPVPLFVALIFGPVILSGWIGAKLQRRAGRTWRRWQRIGRQVIH